MALPKAAHLEPRDFLKQLVRQGSGSLLRPLGRFAKHFQPKEQPRRETRQGRKDCALSFVAFTLDQAFASTEEFTLD